MIISLATAFVNFDVLYQHHAHLLAARLTQILDREECERRGMGLYLGVAAASARQPQFIHLTYSATEAHARCRQVALVGKGDHVSPLHMLSVRAHV